MLAAGMQFKLNTAIWVLIYADLILETNAAPFRPPRPWLSLRNPFGAAFVERLTAHSAVPGRGQVLW